MTENGFITEISGDTEVAGALRSRLLRLPIRSLFPTTLQNPELLPSAPADCPTCRGLTKSKEEETIIINRPGRSTYPDEKSVLTSEATPLNQNVNRDYDPLVGRYIESDPLGLRGGLNPYAYVGNRPTTLTDPKGLLHCGADKSITKYLIPDYSVPFPIVVSFVPACDWHDNCYDTCGADKQACDRGLKDRMQQACNKLSWIPGLYWDCMIQAETYYLFVVSLGDEPYRAAQKAACKNCGKPQ
jgi:RHS repeat-associated protein